MLEEIGISIISTIQ